MSERFKVSVPLSDGMYHDIDRSGAFDALRDAGVGAAIMAQVFGDGLRISIVFDHEVTKIREVLGEPADCGLVNTAFCNEAAR